MCHVILSSDEMNGGGSRGKERWQFSRFSKGFFSAKQDMGKVRRGAGNKQSRQKQKQSRQRGGGRTVRKGRGRQGDGRGRSVIWPLMEFAH